jgi:uncharacterized damage-inducible protein DinB
MVEVVMEYDFLVETYETERLKTLSVWSTFEDQDLRVRPAPLDAKDRNALEHMVHQCMSEDKWFSTMFGMDVGAPPLPEEETRLQFMRRYADDSGKRLAALKEKDKNWWEEQVTFFETIKMRAWIMVRRIAHTAHHRAEQTTLLRLLGKEVYSVYGPSAFSGGLPVNGAITVYPYADLESLLEGESQGGRKRPLPGPGEKPCTERPDG